MKKTLSIIIRTTERSKVLQFIASQSEEEKLFVSNGLYDRVIDNLLTMHSAQNPMILIIEKKYEDGGEYWDVSGLENNQKFAIEFMPWFRWLEMEIVTSHELSDVEILGLILMEMTFVSFDEAEIQEKINNVNDTIKDITENGNGFFTKH